MSGGWTADERLQGIPLECVAADPEDPLRIYAGTEDRGLLRTSDGGRTWTPAGEGIAPTDVTAVAVAPARDRPGTVYAGTEPSALFRSTDGGDTWRTLDGLNRLPSSSTWSFPPRPETHHVRWIGVDPHDSHRIYVAIEAGALVSSHDGGDTWLDRTLNGPYDTHTLALHPHVRGRLYSAAGDGYFESHDGGSTWRSPEFGLRHGYLFGVAVDPADPETVIVSASAGPGSAYRASTASSHVYMRKAGAGIWTGVRAGVPDPRGTTISSFATHPDEPHTVYAANNRGIFHTADAGMSWRRLDVAWPKRFLTQSVQGLLLQP
jgi:photosystem II stability/assembly factor-like uncharacterized protein